MASIIKRGNSWQAIIRRKGVQPVKRSFKLKSEAEHWALETERAIDAGLTFVDSGKTLGNLLDRYAQEESVKKASGDKEQLRFAAFKRDHPALTATKLRDITPDAMAKWRDKRLLTVSEGTVRREWNTLSKAFNVAIKQWRWMDSNPLTNVERPPEPEPRDRLYTKPEIDRIVFVTSYSPDEPVSTISQRLGAMFLFALETAMRCKEITNMRWEEVDLEKRTVTIPRNTEERRTKTGGRSVPLTLEAVRILKQLEQTKEGDTVFNMTERQVDANFRKYRDQAMVKGATFHDAKRYAVTNLAKRMPIQDLARVVGTRNLKILMGYYNRSAEDIAKMLD